MVLELVFISSMTVLVTADKQRRNFTDICNFKSTPLLLSFCSFLIFFLQLSLKFS